MKVKPPTAEICFTKPIGDDCTLVGLAWGNNEKDSSDFDIESFGEVLAHGTEINRKHIGWVVYDSFDGKVGTDIKLKPELKNWEIKED
jgi:hypothetical protein